MGKINDLLYQEEIWIKQRSRVQWLKEGDRNTSFFQNRATQRKTQNRIVSIAKQDGVVTFDQNEVKSIIQNFYVSLYSSQGSNDWSPCWILCQWK